MTTRIKVFFLILLLFLVPALAIAGSEASVEVSPKSGTTDEEFIMQVTVSGDDAREIGEPSFPDSDKFTIEKIGTSQSSSISFDSQTGSKQTFEVVHSYRILPNNLKPGKYDLPRGVFTIDGKEIYLSQPYITITEQTVIKSAPGESKAVDFAQVVDNYEPYVGEQINYSAEILTNSTKLVEVSISPFDSSGFWLESYGDQKEVTRRTGHNSTVVSIKEALYPKSSGRISIPKRVVTGKMYRPDPRRRSRNLNIFDQMNSFGFGSPLDYVNRKFVAEEIFVDVKPLPAPPKGHKGYIPVGRLDIESAVDKQAIKLGESITFKIAIQGDAYLKALDLDLEPSIPKDLAKIYPDKPEEESFPANGRIHSKKIFRFALVPQNSGTIDIPSIEVLTFDPIKKEYLKLKTDPRKILVAPGENQITSLNKNSAKLNKNSKEPIELKPEDKNQSVNSELKPIKEIDLSSANTISNSFLYAYILIVSGIVIFFRYYVWQSKKTDKDIKFLLKQKAHGNFIKELNSANSVLEITKAIKTYLSAKLDIKAKSLTTKEIENILKEALVDQTLNTQASELLAKLEKENYGNSTTSAETISENKELAKDLIGKLEENIK